MNTMKRLRYALYLSVHPFKGFWGIKHEGEGTLGTAILLLVSAIAVQVMGALCRGFLFGGGDTVHYNLVNTVAGFLLVYFTWCVSNWCLTCLSDGEGTLKDICIATAYALIPFILIQLLMIPLSNFFVLREEVFYNMVNNLSVVWTGFLLIIGMLVTHQYSLARTVAVCIFTVVGMVIMGYLGLLFFNLIQQVWGFITILADEIIMRIH